MRIAIWDIEATNLNANFGRILCTCVKEHGKDAIKTFRADRYEKYKTEPWDDSELANDIARYLETFDIWVTWYGKMFDVPFLQTRLILGDKRQLDKTKHVDLYYQARQKLKFHSNRLAAVTEALNVPHRKTPLEPPTWLKATAGHRPSLNKIVTHCRMDVITLDEVYNKLKKYIERVTK